MGQKINPLGFRLGTTQNHHSFWFEQPKNFSVGLQEDEKIRNCIKNYVQKNKRIDRKFEFGGNGITRIEIQKEIDLIKVTIYVGFPNLLEEEKGKTKGMKDLKMNVEKEVISVNRKLKIVFKKIEEPFRHSIILAEYIDTQLKRKIPFRKAIKKAIEFATKIKKVKGIRIQIAGRLGGKDIARVEETKKGRVPLQTICAKIDHCSYPIHTIHGVLGLKIWIFVN